MKLTDEDKLYLLAIVFVSVLIGVLVGGYLAKKNFTEHPEKLNPNQCSCHCCRETGNE